MKIHTFAERLAWGEAAGDEPFWEDIYRRAFGDFVSCSRNGAGNVAQSLGIDRWVHLSSGKTLLVDEKKRDRTDTSDVALEFLSNDRTGALGWIEKDLQIDFLAYGFIPLRVAYLFPWATLRRAWRARGEGWKKQYRIIKANNPGYSTHSVCVPTDVLLRTLADAMRVTLPAVGGAA